ncbi:MAG: acyl-CoA reductase [Lentimicrobiaceae bacterium]|jgi:hypothetical protein|nr:acyl-CoA reductase [Lentimicrobiaceae bacterium]
MLTTDRKIKAFSTLANHLKNIIETDYETLNVDQKAFVSAMQKSSQTNPWFTSENINLAVSNLIEMLHEDSLRKWVANYAMNDEKEPLTIGVVMAGNIPLVGFHDFLCVLMSGNRFFGKLSHDDQYLLPALAEMLQKIEPEFSDSISFTTERLSDFDAIIATGSNNTARYFDYYFGKYPNLIRKNRNSVAVLTGKETNADFEKLADDVFAYFGLGCRSVSTLLVPTAYDFTSLLEIFSNRANVINHARYFNNYEYNKAVFLINKVSHFDNGCLLLTQSDQLNTPISVLHYRYYDSINQVLDLLNNHQEKIQCVVSKNAFLLNSFDFGMAQKPDVQHYADNVDIMQFLLSLHHKIR